jgi:hypothetical protein
VLQCVSPFIKIIIAGSRFLVFQIGKHVHKEDANSPVYKIQRQHICTFWVI